MSTSSHSIFGVVHAQRWRFSGAADLFHTDGYLNVDGDERGAVDQAVASRHALGEAGIELALASGRLFARGSRFVEQRDNGTALQNNSTDSWQWSGGTDLSFRSAGSLSLRAWSQQQDYDQSFSSIALDRESERLTRLQDVVSHSYGVNGQWMRTIGSRHVIVTGFESRRVDADNDERAIAATITRSVTTARQQSASLFLEDVFTATARLTLSAGGRFDSWDNSRARTTGTNAREFPDRSESAFSPRLTARYSVTPQLSLFASAFQAFRAPTLNELYRSFRVGNVLTLANDELSAETTRGGDAGVGVSSLDGRSYLRVALFQAAVDDAIANVTLSTTPALVTRQRKNLGTTRSRGVELDAERRWSALRLSLGYMLADARVREFSADRTLEGNRLPQTPRQQASGAIRYDADRRGLYSLTLRWSDSQFEDDQNELTLEPYTTADVFASWPLRHSTTLWLLGENVSGERFDIGRAGVRTISPPRAISAGLRLRW
jgi:outer membrane receptor protein involved in Fe transport